VKTGVCVFLCVGFEILFALKKHFFLMCVDFSFGSAGDVVLVVCLNSHINELQWAKVRHNPSFLSFVK